MTKDEWWRSDDGGCGWRTSKVRPGGHCVKQIPDQDLDSSDGTLAYPENKVLYLVLETGDSSSVENKMTAFM